MGRKLSRRQQAFTLVEVMVIVALIGLLASLAVPAFVNQRKLSQGKRIVNDARVIDGAINAWAMEAGASDGTPVDVTAAASYTKEGVINTTDILGNDYVIGSVGESQVAISAVSKSALTGVTIDWGSY
jgi:type IV pilus assembly protein PilA